jgi:uncharacterized protein
MPATLTYPGVYIQEIPSGSRAITGVATAVAAFVGRAPRGPVDEPVEITSYAEYSRIFGGVWRESGLGYAVRDYYANGGRQAVIVRLGGGAEVATIDVDGDVTLEAHGPGELGNALEVEVNHATGDEADLVAKQQGVDAGDLFHLTIREGPREDPNFVETYTNVTLTDGPRRLDSVLADSQLAHVEDGFTPATSGRPTERNASTTNEFYASADDGTNGSPLAAANYTGGTLEEDKDGIYALLDADLFTILCLPPTDPAGDLPDAVWADALTLCRNERALLVVDPPATETADTIKAWLAGLGLTADGRNGAIYFPRIRRPDPLRDGAIRPFVPCGAVAGIMARTDSARGVWKAPAGIEAGIAGASGLAVALTDGENGDLNPVGINCLRTFPVIGSVVWGARTLRGADVLADEYKYVPVRRLALFLEETLFRNTQWVVFEPNDEPLWAQIRTSIGAFMQDLFRQGAFQGSTPRDAYFVRCDAETTTQYDIDRGIVNIVVGFAPLKPAEFVVISIQQKTATAAA